MLLYQRFDCPLLSPPPLFTFFSGVWFAISSCFSCSHIFASFSIFWCWDKWMNEITRKCREVFGSKIYSCRSIKSPVILICKTSKFLTCSVLLQFNADSVWAYFNTFQPRRVVAMGFFFVIRNVGLLMMLTGTANPHSRRKLRECEISGVVVQFCSLNNIPNQYFFNHGR